MDSTTVALVLSAGALAALNPCGFALLPAYLGLVVSPPDATGERVRPGAVTAVGRALGATAAMTVGFVLVFAAFGLIVSPVASSAQSVLPYVTIAVGLVLLVLGALMAAGRSVTLPLPHLTRRGGTGLSASLSYGVVYALASLTCTVGPFLALVVTTLRTDDVTDGLVLVGAYALGMGAVVGVAAVAVALAAGTVLSRLRGAGRWLPRATGGLLVVVGAYVAWYGGWEVRVLGGADPADPVVDTALEIQRWLADRVRPLLPGT
ncbi:cytochrome c biogenesis CcdA family protein [Nocardioides sp.]|uniref:cytochrome c biogenesis CcdA family protein n=1 Tax=Nocardioides sp. TaxID=35761 RepID=UPI003517B765